MFPNATVSSRSDSSRSLGSIRNPIYRLSQCDAITSFDAANFVFQEKGRRKPRREPILRRYHSYDSHQSHLEVDSESPGSSRESTGERKGQFEVREFLERFSLPRVVRIEDGEPLLLYRCFDSFTKVEARGLLGKKGREDPTALHFPEGYSGWFSLMNDKGEKCAICYTSILQLVREQVCSFINIQSFTAYTGSSQDTSPGKVQYLKTSVRAGQLFQLRAVFQHKSEGSRSASTKSHSTRAVKLARDKDLSNRYAQLISQNNQELYVPLTTKGEFYEIHSSIKAKLCFPGLLDKTGPLALDKDCLYRITHLLRRTSLPLKVKLLSGPLPPGLPKDYTDTFILTRKFQEPLLVTCTLPPPDDVSKHQIDCINLNSSLKLSKCILGFDSESRLFKSQRLQSALAFCHKNVEIWYREVKVAADLEASSTGQDLRKPNASNLSPSGSLNPTASGSLNFAPNAQKPCENCRGLKGETCESCRRHLEESKHIDSKRPDSKRSDSKCSEDSKQNVEGNQKWKKWYHQILKPQTSHEHEVVTKTDKIKSIDRYKDMSKLIEEKFGKKGHNPVKKSASFMFSGKRAEPGEASSPALLKCQSLDNQLHGEANGMKPDLIPTLSKVKDNSFVMNKLQKSFLMTKGDNSLIRNENENSFTKKENSFVMGEFRKDSVMMGEVKKDSFMMGEVRKNSFMVGEVKDNSFATSKLQENSFMTERLCSEFHVKTKVQKRSSKNDSKVKGVEAPSREHSARRITEICNRGVEESRLISLPMIGPTLGGPNVIGSNIVGSNVMNSNLVGPNIIDSNLIGSNLVGSNLLGSKVFSSNVVTSNVMASNVINSISEDVPYSNVLDEVKSNRSRISEQENIYTEITNDFCGCDKKLCSKCRTKSDADYCYVKLGSNGESLTSDSDEAVYNTLR